MSLLEKEKEWFIEAPWGKLSVVVWGDCCNPPVLLCHGAADSAATFRPLVNLLPQNFYYICVEFPGNGKSDPFPPGMMISVYDLVFIIELVRRHFRWESFIFMAHSMATTVGKLYDIAYEGKMSKVIELDPWTHLFSVTPEDFSTWYTKFFSDYFKKYSQYNGKLETAPKYTMQQAIEMQTKHRGIPEKAARETVERMSVPVQDGFIKLTYDQRTKLITRPPLSPNYIKELFTKIKTPTLTIIANDSVKGGYYKTTPFLFDESSYPGKNYRVRKVEGNHDVHVSYPERVAEFVGKFIMYGLKGVDSKAKL